MTDGNDAMLVPPGDPRALADAIDRLRGDEHLATAIGAAGRRTFIERASEERLGQDWREVIERAIAAAARRKPGRGRWPKG
jgi:glycosyltransferase involved in cell wall biosynthesis